MNKKTIYYTRTSIHFGFPVASFEFWSSKWYIQDLYFIGIDILPSFEMLQNICYNWDTWYVSSISTNRSDKHCSPTTINLKTTNFWLEANWLGCHEYRLNQECEVAQIEIDFTGKNKLRSNSSDFPNK